MFIQKAKGATTSMKAQNRGDDTSQPQLVDLHKTLYSRRVEEQLFL